MAVGVLFYFIGEVFQMLMQSYIRDCTFEKVKISSVGSPLRDGIPMTCCKIPRILLHPMTLFMYQLYGITLGCFHAAKTNVAKKMLMHRNQKLIFLHLKTNLFCKDVSQIFRIEWIILCVKRIYLFSAFYMCKALQWALCHRLFQNIPGISSAWSWWYTDGASLTIWKLSCPVEVL